MTCAGREGGRGGGVEGMETSIKKDASRAFSSRPAVTKKVVVLVLLLLESTIYFPAPLSSIL